VKRGRDRRAVGTATVTLPGFLVLSADDHGLHALVSSFTMVPGLSLNECGLEDTPQFLGELDAARLHDCCRSTPFEHLVKLIRRAFFAWTTRGRRYRRRPRR